AAVVSDLDAENAERSPESVAELVRDLQGGPHRDVLARANGLPHEPERAVGERSARGHGLRALEHVAASRSELRDDPEILEGPAVIEQGEPFQVDHEDAAV